MSIFEHARQRIINPHQHPYRHAVAEFAYMHPALGGLITNLEQALNYLFAVLYPKSKDAVATKGDLPVAGNVINDYRVVLDDGDGKSAGYRFFQIDGEVGPGWHKTTDLDWGYDSVLSSFLTSTQDQYVAKWGRDDVDINGVPLAGELAGQRFYGGASNGSSLTLFANNGDGAGPNSGFVQFGDDVRPLIDGGYSLGTDTYRFMKGWFDELQAGTLNLKAGVISDSSGAISFVDENVTSTGTFTGSKFIAGTHTSEAGKISDSSGKITFDCKLETSGDVVAKSFSASVATSSFKTGTTVGTLTLADGSIKDSSGAISFDNENLSTTGSITGGQVNADNLRLDNNTLSVTHVDGDLNLLANGTGKVNLSSPVAGSTIQLSGDLSVDNLKLDGNTVSTTNTNGDLVLTPNGLGLVSTVGVYPTTDSALDLGKITNVWNKLWLDGSLGCGLLEISMATLLSFREAIANVNAGDCLFWDGFKWLPSKPDLEIDHTTIKEITTGDAGHTQFAMLGGRASGQSLRGGVAASENLTLQSTAHATRGSIVANDNLVPGVATVDLGDATHLYRDLYSSGQLRGARLENFTTVGRPAAASGNVGRMIWDTTLSDIIIDAGGSWVNKSVDRWMVQDAATWNGVVTTVTYTVDGTVTPARGVVSDARFCTWQLLDNADSYKQIGCEISKTQTTVTVKVDLPLPAGTYTLLGIG